MLPDELDNKQCLDEAESVNHLYEEIPPVVKKLTDCCNQHGCFDHLGAIPIPTYENVVQIIDQARRILFPGFFSSTPINPANLEYCLGQETTELFENLASQIVLAIQHECFQAPDENTSVFSRKSCYKQFHTMVSRPYVSKLFEKYQGQRYCSGIFYHGPKPVSCN